MKTDAEFVRRGELSPGQITAAPGKDIVMVKAGCTAVLEQFTEACEGRKPDNLLVQVLPDFIQGLFT